MNATKKVNRQPPEEGKWYEVNPQYINQTLFWARRVNHDQESTRANILKAFAELRNNPAKYKRTFETLVPIKAWDGEITIEEINQISKCFGGNTINWVELYLELAQRIENESWENVCNKPDTNRSYILIKWQDGLYRIGGGSKQKGIGAPAANILAFQYKSTDMASFTIPKVVRYR